VPLSSGPGSEIATGPPPKVTGTVTELIATPLRYRLSVEPAGTPETLNTGLRTLVTLSPNKPVSEPTARTGADSGATLVGIAIVRVNGTLGGPWLKATSRARAVRTTVPVVRKPGSWTE